jgi:hypothetical protein
MEDLSANSGEGSFPVVGSQVSRDATERRQFLWLRTSCTFRDFLP